jgi:hypothetical protein
MRKNSKPAEGPEELVYQCRLSLSSAAVNMAADLVRGHLKKIGSRWRKLSPGRIAVIVLAVLRHDSGFATWLAAMTCPPPPCAAGCWK